MNKMKSGKATSTNNESAEAIETTETAEATLYAERQVFVLAAIEKEVSAQRTKWGVQKHNDLKWLAILMEEVGEAAKEINEDDDSKLRDELIQCAAVIVSWLKLWARY